MIAKSGDKVKVHYTLKDINNEVIESSRETHPLEFTLGDKHVIPGFDKGVTGMKVGESKTINIPFADAYGPRNEAMIFEFDKSKAPEQFDPAIGQTVKLHRADGMPVMATVIGKTVNGFTMDANHPLAGKDLTFDLELVEIITE
ncbi:MAG: FKBP-type peptidyl-prolyl cis-trans isomerase [Nitrospirae bacterium]|nr:FKBP-type peptidyl-prolyl cis-trans isomerase [Nitrospirota bacterium]